MKVVATDHEDLSTTELLTFIVESGLTIDCDESYVVPFEHYAGDVNVSAINDIQSFGMHSNASSSMYAAGEAIELSGGFEVGLGSVFSAVIEGCE